MPDETEKDKTVVLETETVETDKFTGMKTYKWNEVSHVLIGPDGATVLSAEMAASLKVPKTSTPQPGYEDTVPFTQLCGFMNEVGELKSTLAKKEEMIKSFEAEVASLKEQITVAQSETDDADADAEDAKADEVADEQADAESKAAETVEPVTSETGSYNDGTVVLTNLLKKARENRIL